MQAAEFRLGIGVFLAVSSEAAAPGRPAYPRPIQNLAVAGALGLMDGLAFAMAREVLRGPAPAVPPVPESESVAPAAGMARDKRPSV